MHSILRSPACGAYNSRTIKVVREIVTRESINRKYICGKGWLTADDKVCQDGNEEEGGYYNGPKELVCKKWYI